MSIGHFLLLFIIMFNAFESVEASVLSEIVANMPNRTFVKMPLNDSLRFLSLENSHFYFADTGEWDPVQDKLIWMGGPGRCCTKKTTYKMVVYHERSDLWETISSPYDGAGHAYDGNAFDPLSNSFYFSLFRNKHIKKFQDDKWSSLPAIPFRAPDAAAIAWFPDVSNDGGLIYVGSGRNLALFNGFVWKKILVGENKPWGRLHVFAQYNQIHKMIWFGGGNKGVHVHYGLDASLKIKKYEDAPIPLKVGGTIHTVDPLSGNYIVTLKGKSEWWEFDPIHDSWMHITNMQGDIPPKEKGPWMVVPVYKYGVNLYLRQIKGKRHVYIYKHGKSDAPANTP